jgi:hypothetical protein
MSHHSDAGYHAETVVRRLEGSLLVHNPAGGSRRAPMGNSRCMFPTVPAPRMVRGKGSVRMARSSCVRVGGK